MSYEKTIVCLANSRKHSGRCIAGKEVIDGGCYGSWIRPISRRDTQEISEEERVFENGDYPQVLDIISIKFNQKEQNTLQPENHFIDPHVHWKSKGKIKYDDLTLLKDKPNSLWINGLSSSNGKNDRIAITNTQLPASLYLVYLDTLKIKVLNPFQGKRKVRALFQHNKDSYNLSVTDPKVEYYFLKKQNGEYTVQNVYLCISISEPFENYCYKLVASIIRESPF